MNGKHHAIGGLATGAVAASLAAGPSWGVSLVDTAAHATLIVVGAGVGCVGALAPDLDKDNTIASTTIPLVSPVLSAIVRFFCFNKHRTLTHWLPLWVAAGYIMVYRIAPPSVGWPHVVILSFCVGYIGHLLEDAMTRDGIPCWSWVRVPCARVPIVPFFVAWQVRLPVPLPWGHWHVIPRFLTFPSDGGKREKVALGLILLGCVAVETGAYVPAARALEAHAVWEAVVTLDNGIRALVGLPAVSAPVGAR